MKHLSIISSSLLLAALALTGCSGSTSTVTRLMEENGTAKSYTDKAVTTDDIDRLIGAAETVPSIRNVSQWQFIAIGEGAELQKLTSVRTLGGGLANARAAVVICGLSRRFNDGDARALWQQDCAAAAQNILLTARSMGMTPNWVRIYPMQQRVNEVKSALNLDPGVIPFAVISLGYADDENIVVTEPAKQPEVIRLGSFSD